MTKLALFVPLEANSGNEEEPGTTTWYAVRFDHNTFAIFDAFPDEAARDAHLAGKVAVALIQRAPGARIHHLECFLLDVTFDDLR